MVVRGIEDNQFFHFHGLYCQVRRHSRIHHLPLDSVSKWALFIFFCKFFTAMTLCRECALKPRRFYRVSFLKNMFLQKYLAKTVHDFTRLPASPRTF